MIPCCDNHSEVRKDTTLVSLANLDRASSACIWVRRTGQSDRYLRDDGACMETYHDDDLLFPFLSNPRSMPFINPCITVCF
jgi:hypothetical protein